MSVNSAMTKLPQPPVLVVLGATGAGKSKLAIELAQRFKGEIISADAMQMYKGLDIVTNKVTAEEQQLVKHHLINFLDPLKKTWTVVDFRNKALAVVEDLLKNNIMPVICGGTNYYIESLVWKILIDKETTSLNDDTSHGSKKRKLDNEELEHLAKENKDLSKLSNEQLHAKLMQIDPDRANELHPNERRKIRRSLEVFEQHGKPHGKLLDEQKSQQGGSILGGPLRYSNCLVLWVQSDQEILDDRCDKRVDKMIERGMVKELEDFHRDYNSKRTEPADYTMGIFQSIGFKEFHEYLLLDDELKQQEIGKETFQKGVTQLKLVTRQYARRQVRWIRQRFLNPYRNCPKVYAVDSSNPGLWDDKCFNPAVDIVDSFIRGIEIKQEPVSLIAEKSFAITETRKIFSCSVCSRNIKGIEQFQVHMSSRKHKKQQRLHNLNMDKYSLVLTSWDPDQKLQVRKKLKDLTGLPLSEVEERFEVANLPQDLGLKLTLSNAEEVLSELGTDAMISLELRKLSKDQN